MLIQYDKPEKDKRAVSQLSLLIPTQGKQETYIQKEPTQSAIQQEQEEVSNAYQVSNTTQNIHELAFTASIHPFSFIHFNSPRANHCAFQHQKNPTVLYSNSANTWESLCGKIKIRINSKTKIIAEQKDTHTPELRSRGDPLVLIRTCINLFSIPILFSNFFICSNAIF